MENKIISSSTQDCRELIVKKPALVPEVLIMPEELLYYVEGDDLKRGPYVMHWIWTAGFDNSRNPILLDANTIVGYFRNIADLYDLCRAALIVGGKEYAEDRILNLTSTLISRGHNKQRWQSKYYTELEIEEKQVLIDRDLEEKPHESDSVIEKYTKIYTLREYLEGNGFNMTIFE